MTNATTSGAYTNGLPEPAELLTSAARMPLDTGLASGRTPQTVAMPLALAAAGVVVSSTPLTGFTITVPDGVSMYLITPAGTLATGTFTMPANPFEGQILWLVSSQTQTALTVSANTGQTLSGTAVTALTRSVAVAWVYIDTVWYRVQ